jgi:hypothetical protein
MHDVVGHRYTAVLLLRTCYSEVLKIVSCWMYACSVIRRLLSHWRKFETAVNVSLPMTMSISLWIIKYLPQKSCHSFSVGHAARSPMELPRYRSSGSVRVEVNRKPGHKTKTGACMTYDHTLAHRLWFAHQLQILKASNISQWRSTRLTRLLSEIHLGQRSRSPHMSELCIDNAWTKCFLVIPLIDHQFCRKQRYSSCRSVTYVCWAGLGGDRTTQTDDF